LTSQLLQGNQKFCGILIAVGRFFGHALFEHGYNPFRITARHRIQDQRLIAVVE